MATLKTAQTPLAAQTLAQWRTEAGLWIGETYSSLSTDLKTTFDRLLNEAHDYISKRAAHQPWGVEETTLTLTAGVDTLYAMPASFRHLILIVEEEAGGAKTRVEQTTKIDYMNAETGSTAHQWATNTVPKWFFDGYTTAEPPVQQWRRIGTDKTGATARVQFRPYFGVLAASGQDAYTVLPAAEVPAIRAQFQYSWALFRKNFDEAGVYRQVRDDEIAANEINDRVTVEDPPMQGLTESFLRELG